MEHLTTKEKNGIRSNSRKVWMMLSQARKEVIDRCRQTRGVYKCENCGAILHGNSSVLAVDHVSKVGPVTDPSFLGNLWCPVSNLWGLCHDCHKLKTKLERKNTPLAEILKILRERLP